jgi:ABC-type Na+ efflux pump permease subunit
MGAISVSRLTKSYGDNVDLAGVNFEVGAGETVAILAEGPALLAVVLFGAISWAALGTAVAAFIPDAGSAGPLLSATYLPVVFVSGVFVPIAAEPGWLATVARWLPAEPFIHALSTTLQAGGSGVPAAPPAGDLLNCALWAAVGLYVALRHFRWEPRGGEHRGHATGRLARSDARWRASVHEDR